MEAGTEAVPIKVEEVEEKPVTVLSAATVEPPPPVTAVAYSSDTLRIRVRGTPLGTSAPPIVSRIVLDPTLDRALNTTAWFSRGPGEPYRGRKTSERVGNWILPLDKLFTVFEYPKESGNRTDVRRVASSGADRRSLSANFGDRDGCSFNASYYDAADVEHSRHPYELREFMRQKEPRVRLDWAHHGLGTAAVIGPGTRPEYTLTTGACDYEVTLE
jgi:beta-galactosidase